MKREHWGGRLAFVLAAAGSAVGLGNIWKFPYITGVHGGAAFILVYLVCIALVGMPVMVAELAIGRATQKSPIAAFRELHPGAWWLVGGMGVLAGYVILSFYSVVAGWTLDYAVRSIQGNYSGLTQAEVKALEPSYLEKKVAAEIARLEAEAEDSKEKTQAGELSSKKEVEARIRDSLKHEDLEEFAIAESFGGYIAQENPTKPLLWHLAFMVITMLVVSAGVGGGIEKASKVLMPLLIVIILGIAIRGLMLENSWQGVEFLITPDFSKLTRESILEALGHAFFTLSLGMGAMLTYGSYLSKDTNLYMAGLWVVIADTLIALLAGLAIYPAVFAYGLDAGAGPGLIFVTLPVLFRQLPGGYFIGTLFFGALFIAALTSAISLLEVCVAHFVDELEWDRKKATAIAGVTIAVVGASCASFKFLIPAAVPFFGGMSYFDFLDKLSSNVLLPIGGMFLALFVGYAWNEEDLLASLSEGDDGLTRTLGKPWLFLCRTISPLLVLVVVAHKLGLLPH